MKKSLALDKAAGRLTGKMMRTDCTGHGEREKTIAMMNNEDWNILMEMISFVEKFEKELSITDKYSEEFKKMWLHQTRDALKQFKKDLDIILKNHHSLRPCNWIIN